jgi:molybdopterin-guanine dinucleotide biosynthesis protein A
VVLAGSRGTRLFEVEGKQVPKPHLVVGGQPLVRWVVQAVLAAGRVGKIYVVGQVDLLKESLAGLDRDHPDRLRLIEEGQDILDNSYRAFFLHLLSEKKLEPIASEHLDPDVISEYRERYLEHLNLPAFIVTADLPFISSRAVDEFLASAPGNAAVVMGLVNHEQLQRMQSVLGAECALDYWKLGALQLRNKSVRLNNLFLVRPLQVDPAFYRLLTRLYAHRWLLKQDGRVNFKNWWAIAKATVSYSLRLRGFFRFLRGIVNFVPAALASCLARFTHRYGR